MPMIRDFPHELNGIPLSERTRWLLFGPIQLVANPRWVVEHNPFEKGGWAYDVFVNSPAARALTGGDGGK